MIDSVQVLDLVQWHLHHHTAVGITDVYKLLYQGVMGAEHLLQDEQRAHDFLTKEWDAVPSDKNLMLLEPVSVNGQVVRLNIARAKANGVSLQQVWQVFYFSVQNFILDKDVFEHVWALFYQLCEEQKLPFEIHDVQAFTENVRMQNFPAMHHSEAYRKANRPAYRVVSKQQFEHMMRKR